MLLSRCPRQSLCVLALLSGLVLSAGLTGCDCEGTIASRAVAEMSADPDRVPADGRPGVEVSILVFADSPGRVPMQGVVVEVRSDRNAAGTVDEIEQPAGPTDADGRAVAFVGSSQEGVVELSAWSGGDPLCSGYDEDGCVPAVVQVTFEQTCPSGQTACGGQCVDIATNLEHCGRCDNACDFDNAAALCTMGVCAMGACETGFGDCNRDSTDGCEAVLASDPLNCGSCDNACTDGEVCRDGDCALPCADADGDGYEDEACGGPDCADDDPDVHPGAAEDCDGVDDDCDGQTDEDLDASACDDQNPCTADTCEPGVGCQYENLDGQPCDDADACTAADTCLNAGCFGTPVDADSDGYRPVDCGGADCDDENAAVNPGQTEVGALCSNGVDDDCDGQLDGADSQCEACGQDADCDDGNPCNGVETCQATACQAGSPPDCDDGNPCTTDSCDPGVVSGCVNEPAQAACDDGQWCTVNDQCDLGQCTGQARDCSGAGDTCNAGVCDEALDQCLPSALPDDTPCDDGVFCTEGDVCQAGTCQGGPRDCSGVADQCNNATCDEAAGACMPVPIADGTLCSDGFYCTTGDACAAGVCQGQARDCSGFGNQCNQGACDEVANTCTAEPLPDGTACSDGVFCTDNDACTAGVCGGTARDCSAVADQCNTGACDELAGACVPQPVANGTACDDADACSMNDACSGGVCGGVPLDADGDLFVDQACGGQDCDDSDAAVNPSVFEGPFGDPICSDGADNDCDTHTDDADTGCQECVGNADCDDGDVCNGAETCQAGSCMAGSPLSCDDGNACTDDSCDAQAGCQHANHSRPCDDGQWCTLNDVCDGAGTCVGSGTPCAQQCLGTCNEVQQQCDPSPDGTGCNDGQWCTENDVCTGGTCAGGARDCSAAGDQCNAGVCDEAGDACVAQAVPDGTGCDDGLFCTSGDVCTGGSCGGFARNCDGAGNQCNDGVCDEGADACVAQPLADGTLCNDGAFCTVSDACTGGVCGGSARDCSGAGDQCNTGVCSEAQDQCVPQAVPDGTGCNDGAYCTVSDACTAGVCGGSARDCSAAGDQCNTGVCDDVSDACEPQPVADGTGCNDGLYCTRNDVCTAGVCDGAARDCSAAGDQCNTGVCNDVSDACEPQPVADGTGCNDGAYCTVSDQCTGGACGGSARDCSAAGDQCNAGVCNDVSDACEPQPVADGTGCDDGAYCTVGDACSSGVCDGTPRDCSAAGDQCNTGVCNDVSNACEAQPVADGTGCSDGLYCTRNDVCTGGVCDGAPRDCSAAGNQCNTGVCNDVSDACEPQPVADGTGCNDGAYCTVGDQCTGGACGGTARDCSAAGDQCNTGVCNDVADSCEPQPVGDGTACNDGDPCTMADACTGGVCDGPPKDSDGDGFVDEACPGGDDCDDDDGVINPGVFEGPGGDPKCNDGFDNDCDSLSDLNDPGCGECFSDPDCDDGDVCNGAETCVAGSCVAGALLDCDDGNPCTDDSCDAATGCQYGFNTDPCNDGLYCTLTDTCDGAGTCVGAGARCVAQCLGTCDEANDECDPSPDGTGCNDGDWCTISDECAGGVCGGAARDCSGVGDQCNDGVCDEAGDQCVAQPVADGTGCNDGAYCTVGDACSGGICDGTPRDCSGAGDQCNTGVCNDVSNACEPQAVADGTGCSDGQFCTVSDQCTGGACGGSPRDCSGAGDQCNTGVCNDVSNACEPQAVADGTGCNDGQYCTVGDACAGGVCDGAARDCSGAADQCNAGVCDDLSDQCVASPLADGTPCEDGLFCTAGDACDGAGACAGGVGDPCPVVCQSVCNEGGDSCDDDPNGTGCDDGNGCTMNDACTAGVCSGPPTDGDGDGYVWDACGGGDDCNDGNGAINPGATEVCDGVDNDCDGLNDQRLCSNQEGVCAGSLQGCSAGDWQACDYGALASHEWVEVSCDGLDNDCDGCTDEGCAGYGNPVVSVEVIPFTSRPGLSRISGNGQAGPVGAVLPNALIVQLNDGAGNPMPGELVNFAVEPIGAVCYGQGGIHAPSNGLNDLVIHLVCNDVDSGSLASPAQVRTDINGQAQVFFQLPADVPGMSGISATADGQTVAFFASSTQALADNDPIDLPGDGYSPPDNPAVGPLTVTIRSGGSAAFMSDPDNYTLTMTGLSSSADANGGNGVADAPLTAGGTLTISGRNFSTPANANSVWIGGLPATVTGGSSTSLTVQIPAGTPGAAPVVVDDGTSTTFAGGTGNIPSVASSVANLWRLAPKPIYIFADTGSQAGSTAQVKLLGRDVCGNPLDLAGESISLWTEDPDGSSPSGPVSVGAPHPSTGVATVANTGATRDAAYVVGSVGALSSADFTDGNTTVTTVAWSRSPATFVEDPALANDDGINSIIFRGGTGGSGETNNPDMNPAVRFTFVDQTNYVIPDGAGPDYETEAHIVAGTMIGEGNITYVPGSNRRAAMAGTGLLVASGSPAGVLGTVSANASYCIRIVFWDVCGDMSVEGVLLPGWYRQTVSEQEYEMNYSGLMYYDVDEHRNLILRLLTQRALP